MAPADLLSGESLPPGFIDDCLLAKSIHSKERARELSEFSFVKVLIL